MTIPRPDPFDLVGTTIAGKYDVEEMVAHTALSAVYRATHRVWHRRVAIKAFNAPSLSDEARQQLLASFVDEGRLLMELSERCAAICQARDVSSLTTRRGDWVPYTVLEWLDGECLEILLRRERAQGARPRTLTAVVELLNPIAEALAIAHERGVVHRDVKPGNIFVLSGAAGEAIRTKLLDFGVAKVMRGAAAAPGVLVSQSFTPSYGAPEQFSSAYGTTGPWTDVFALGLIVVELLTGREALHGDVVGTLGAQSCDPDVRPTARRLGAAVTDEVESVLERALAVRFEDRFGNARELWSALRDALAAQLFAERLRAVPAPSGLGASAGEGGPRTDGGPPGAESGPEPADSARGEEGEIHVEWDVPRASPEFAPAEAASLRTEIALSSTIPIALSRRRGEGRSPLITKEH